MKTKNRFYFLLQISWNRNIHNTNDTNMKFSILGVLQNLLSYKHPRQTNSFYAPMPQTHNLQIINGPTYSINEYVYQGSSANNAFAYGYLNAISNDNTTVRLTKVRGTFRVGEQLFGVTSGVARTVTSVLNPTFEPYSGDILYIENNTVTTRADGQAENIKLTVSF